MNKKLVLRNPLGKIVYCVLAPSDYYTDQLLKVFGIKKGYGITVELRKKTVDIVNYFRADTQASFEIISFEDTDDEVLLELKEQM